MTAPPGTTGATDRVVRTLVLDPSGRATLTDAVLQRLHRELDAAEADPACRAVLLQGGSGTFCTGMDLDEADEQIPAGSAERFFDLLHRFTTSGLVVVAVVDGKAVGGGVGLVAASDIALATPRAEFSLPELLWGLLPCCVFPFLLRRIGFQAAHAMALSTVPVPADRAATLGLVDEVDSEPGVVLRRLLTRVGKLRPATVRAWKQYAEAFSPLPPDTRERAVTQLRRRAGSPDVRAALDRYRRHGRFPWEPD